MRVESVHQPLAMTASLWLAGDRQIIDALPIIASEHCPSQRHDAPEPSERDQRAGRFRSRSNSDLRALPLPPGRPVLPAGRSIAPQLDGLLLPGSQQRVGQCWSRRRAEWPGFVRRLPLTVGVWQGTPSRGGVVCWLATTRRLSIGTVVDSLQSLVVRLSKNPKRLWVVAAHSFGATIHSSVIMLQVPQCAFLYLSFEAEYP